jgi:hypothetical protein
MRMVLKYVVRPLFQTRTADDALWMFVIHPDDRWAITRNGKEVRVGTAQRESVIAGVDCFRSLTSPVIRAGTECDVTVGELLDRIEDERPPVAQLQAPRTVRGRALKRSLAGATSSAESMT